MIIDFINIFSLIFFSHAILIINVPIQFINGEKHLQIKQLEFY